MQYEELIDLLHHPDNQQTGTGKTVQQLLSPRPLQNPEDLERMISTRFRYTGPGKWVRVLRDTSGK